MAKVLHFIAFFCIFAVGMLWCYHNTQYTIRGLSRARNDFITAVIIFFHAR